MDEKQRYNYPLCSSDEKKDSNEALEESEEDQEGREGYERNSLVEKILHHLARRTKSYDLQDSKPEEDNEQRET